MQGRIAVPASKSLVQRYLALSCLSQDNTVLGDFSGCDDTDTALQIIRDLGCSLEERDDTICIRPGQNRHNTLLQCNESGLCMRMFAPVVSLFDDSYSLYSKGSLSTRPMHFLKKPLMDMGAKVLTNNGYPPVRICGPAQGGAIEVDAGITSQLLTGLLVSLHRCPRDSEITVRNLKSSPYIDMTLEVLEDFGVSAEYSRDYSYFYIRGSQECRPVFKRRDVEGDWSCASFFLVAGALGGRVEVDNIRPCSRQADRKILDVLKEAGAVVEVAEGRIAVESSELMGFSFDASDCPDLFPPLTALAVNCSGISRIYGASRLIYKESNRVRSIMEGFAKAGADIVHEGDYLEIRGKELQGGVSGSFGDHRIAMALAVSALRSREGIRIEDYGVVSKSFPEFFNILDSIIKEKP